MPVFVCLQCEIPFDLAFVMTGTYILICPISHHDQAFVGNLPLDVSDEELRAHFSDCGDIVSVRVIRDPLTGVGKGIGFVRFADKGAVSTAVAMAGVPLRDRPLRVTHSTADGSSGGSGGRDGGRGRGRGGRGGSGRGAGRIAGGIKGSSTAGKKGMKDGVGKSMMRPR